MGRVGHASSVDDELVNDICKDLYSASRISPDFFMRSAEGDERKDVFTFAELFGAGRFNEEDGTYTDPSKLLEDFITKKILWVSLKRFYVS